MNDKSLKTWYTRLNKEYFNGKLPNISVRFATLINAAGRTHYDENWKPVSITIHPFFKKWPTSALGILIHEMAHVAVVVFTGDTKTHHGGRWQYVMYTLAAKGALERFW